jgi:hypothetical protein
MDKPLHIVVWQDSNVDGYSSNVTILNERIAKLEAAIERITLSSTTGASSAALTTSEEKKTPLISGIDMKRMPDSTGSLSAVNPPDVRNILYNLITQPPLSSINKYINPDTPSSASHILNSYASSANNIQVDEAPFDLDAGDEDSTINLLSAQEEDDVEEEEDDADAAELEEEVDAAELEEEADAAELEEEADAAELEDDAPEELEEDDAPGVEDDAPEELEVEAEELEEFEYKGTAYWKDSQNQVYITDESGDLVDEPYGVWSDEKKKVLKYPK